MQCFRFSRIPLYTGFVLTGFIAIIIIIIIVVIIVVVSFLSDNVL